MIGGGQIAMLVGHWISSWMKNDHWDDDYPSPHILYFFIPFLTFLAVGVYLQGAEFFKDENAFPFLSRTLSGD